MIQANDIIRRMGILLLDEDNVRWLPDELLDWAHDGGKVIVSLDHKAGAEVEEVELVQGALQEVDALEVMNVVRLLPSGRPIQRTDRYLLDSSDPDWYNRKPTSKIVHYTVDDRDKARFYVYPPAAAGTKVEALIAKLPDKPEVNGTLNIGSEYMDALINYIAYRAFSKDSEFANGQVAASYYQVFQSAIAGPQQASFAVSPNNQQQMPGGEE